MIFMGPTTTIVWWFALPSACVLMSEATHSWTVITFPLTSAGYTNHEASEKWKGWIFLLKKQERNFPGGQWLNTVLPLWEVWVWSLVRELRSWILQVQQKIEKKKKKLFPFCFCGPSLDLSWRFYLLGDLMIYHWGHLRHGFVTQPPQLNRWPLWRHRLAWHQPFLLHTQAPAYMVAGEAGELRGAGSYEAVSKGVGKDHRLRPQVPDMLHCPIQPLIKQI